MFNISTQSKTLESSFVDNRRQDEDLKGEQNSLWDKLNLSQQFSVCSLGQFGYILTYVRMINNRPLAVLKLDKKIATINDEGLINVSPYISIRH